MSINGISNEDFLQTGFPTQYSTFGEMYTDKNPYVPTNYLQTYPMFIAPEFGKYYSDPLRGPRKPQLNSNPRGVSNLKPELEDNYIRHGGWNMLSGGQEAMQLYPSYPYNSAVTAYENDYYFTNQNLDISDVYNNTKYFSEKYRNDHSGNSQPTQKVTVNPPLPYRDPNCMTQGLVCKPNEILAVKYPTEIWKGNKKCACYPNK